MLVNGACHFLWLIRVRLWNCASIQVPLMVSQIRLLFADILRRKINFWALPNSKISILSTFLSRSPYFCAVLIMSRHWAPMLLVLSGRWCACLQVEKWMAVSKAWLLFQEQVLALTQMHRCTLLSCQHNSAEKFLLGGLRWREELQNLTLSSFLFRPLINFFFFFSCDFNLILKRHRTIINRMSGYIIPLMERNPLWTNAPKNRVENDKEHVYIKPVMDSLFVW